MSEEQAGYQPQARITQNAKGVWILNPKGHTTIERVTAEGYETGITYSGLMIGPAIVGEGESLSSVINVTPEQCAGAEMTLMPKVTTFGARFALANHLLRSCVAEAIHLLAQRRRTDFPFAAECELTDEDITHLAVYQDDAEDYARQLIADGAWSTIEAYIQVVDQLV